MLRKEPDARAVQAGEEILQLLQEEKMSITSFSYTGSQEDRSRKTEEEKMSDVNEVGEVGGMDVVELERVLTPEAQAERDDFDAEVADRGCTCFISPPCGYCTHPGNPHNQEEDETAWMTAGGKDE